VTAVISGFPSTPRTVKEKKNGIGARSVKAAKKACAPFLSRHKGLHMSIDHEFNFQRQLHQRPCPPPCCVVRSGVSLPLCVASLRLVVSDLPATAFPLPLREREAKFVRRQSSPEKHPRRPLDFLCPALLRDRSTGSSLTAFLSAGLHRPLVS
jgi:hypothetical protein